MNFTGKMKSFFPAKAKNLIKLGFIACLILVFGSSNAFASSRLKEQKLNLKLKDVTLQECLKAIEAQSDMVFVYNEEQVDVMQTVSVNAKNESVEYVLNEVLENATFKMYDNQVVILAEEVKTTASTQEDKVVITGTVLDQYGMGIPGVNVTVKGTTLGTITNIDGQFSLEVSANSVIVYSFIGFASQEVTVAPGASYNVTLQEDVMNVDEVVVTALGIKRETKKLGFAMTEVKGEDVASANTVSAVSALQGKGAGISIGGSDGGMFGNSKIQVRGVSVMNSSNNQPIFVVDGVILDNDIHEASADWNSSSNDFGNQLKNLNPDDFESVSVLKGAAATALYGSRGINGAVIIKTKDGAGSKGLGVKVTQSIGIDHVYRQPDIQTEFGQGTIAGYVSYGETYKDENGKDQFYKYDTQQVYTNADGVISMVGSAGLGWGPRYDGRPVVDYDGTMTTYKGIKNNMLDAYDVGFNTNTSVAISGGNEKGTFYLSDSYNKRTGVIPNSEFTRNSLKLAGTYNLSEWLKADASVSFTTSNPKNPWNDLGSNFATGSWTNWYNTDKYKEENYYVAKHGGLPSNSYGDENANIPGRSLWFAYNKNSFERQEQVTRPIVRLTADVTDWMSVTAEANMNYYTAKTELKELGQGYANDGGKYILKHESDKSQTGKITANFKKSWDNMSANLIVGGEVWKQEKSFQENKTRGGLIVPGKFFLENSRETLETQGKIEGEKQINSLYYLLNLGWKDQVYVDITGRNDWSSALVYTNGTGNYSYFYPSVSTSWLLSETFEMPAWISFGKIRLSWAQVGNDTSPYFINRGYTIGKNELEKGFAYNNAMSDVQVDPSIKPERKNSFEAGLDLRMFKNRLGIDFAIYDETINDQIGEVPMVEESGLRALITNVGTLKNEGIELSVKVTPVRNTNFEWVSTVNYWKNKTTITDLHERYGAYRVLGGAVNYGNFRVGSVAFEDGEYGVLMSDSKPKVDPKTGKKVLRWDDSKHGAHYVRSGVVEEVGKIQPDFEGSWQNDFSYKNLSVGILLDARFGGHMASYSNHYGTAYGHLETSLNGRDAANGGITWTSKYADASGKTYVDGIIPDGVFEDGQIVTTPTGAKENVGGMTYQEAYEKGFVEPVHASYYTYFNNSWSRGVVNSDWFSEVNYIALRNISIGYQMPKSIAEKIKAQKMYVSLNARNLGYLYNSLPNNLHPESFRGTSSSTSFLERSFTPYTATYTMTIAIDF